MMHNPDIFYITFNEAKVSTPCQAYPLAPHSVLKAVTSSEVLVFGRGVGLCEEAFYMIELGY